MGGLSSLFKKSKVEDLPARVIDPKFTGAQDALYNFGTEGIKGNFNPYYGAIGSYGGKELNDMIALNTADIQRAGAESAAARGISGSRALAATSKAIADMSTNMRYSDFIRAMSGRQSLLNTSLATTQDVRNAASEEMASQNAYNLANAQYRQKQKAANDAKISNLISTGISLAGLFATGGMSAIPMAAGSAAKGGSGLLGTSRGSVSTGSGFLSGNDVGYDEFGLGLNFAS